MNFRTLVSVHPQYGPLEDGNDKDLGEKKRKKKKKKEEMQASIDLRHPQYGPVEDGEDKDVRKDTEKKKTQKKHKEQKKKEMRIQIESPEILQEQHKANNSSQDQPFFRAPDKFKSREGKEMELNERGQERFKHKEEAVPRFPMNEEPQNASNPLDPQYGPVEERQDKDVQEKKRRKKKEKKEMELNERGQECFKDDDEAISRLPMDEEPPDASNSLDPQYGPVEDRQDEDVQEKKRRKKKRKKETASLDHGHPQFGPVEDGVDKDVRKDTEKKKKEKKNKKDMRVQLESREGKVKVEDAQEWLDQRGGQRTSEQLNETKGQQRFTNDDVAVLRLPTMDEEAQKMSNSLDPQYGPVEDKDVQGKKRRKKKKRVRVSGPVEDGEDETVLRFPMDEEAQVINDSLDPHVEDGQEKDVQEKKRRKKKRKKEMASLHFVQPQSGPVEDEEDKDVHKDMEKKKLKKKKEIVQVESPDIPQHQHTAGGVSKPRNGQEKKRRMSFPDQNLKEDGSNKKLIWGKRFTKEEDEILRQAVLNYIKERGWDEARGINFVMNCQKHKKEARGCWRAIRRCLPHRPRNSIRYRAHGLFEEGTHLGRWSKEEIDTLRRLQAEYGNNWRKISTLMGRGRSNIKERWRTLKRPQASGSWTQADLQQLSGLVHKCLWAKAKYGIVRNPNDHRILRDDINWEKIADEIGIHGHGSCCGQWYYTLASSMIASGQWANCDDMFMLQRLLESGACTEEEVEWDYLLDHRLGRICLIRWQQMVKHLGENKSRPFLEKLQLLARRYAPQLLESYVEDDNEKEP